MNYPSKFFGHRSFESHLLFRHKGEWDTSSADLDGHGFSWTSWLPSCGCVRATIVWLLSMLSGVLIVSTAICNGRASPPDNNFTLNCLLSFNQCLSLCLLGDHFATTMGHQWDIPTTSVLNKRFLFLSDTNDFLTRF